MNSEENVDRSSTECLEAPHDRHGRCLLKHSCDLRRYVSRLRSHWQELEADSGALLNSPEWAMPSKHWKQRDQSPQDFNDAAWQSWKPLRDVGKDEVVAAVKQSMLHLADHTGFDSVCCTPLSVLVDATTHYIQAVCTAMADIADCQFPTPETDWAILLKTLERGRAANCSSPLELHKYWIQSVWNVTVRRQRAAQTLRKAIFEGSPNLPSLLETSASSKRKAATQSPSAPTKTLQPIAVLGSDGTPLTIKVGGEAPGSDSPQAIKTEDTEGNMPSPYIGASVSPSGAFSLPSPAALSPALENSASIAALTPPVPHSPIITSSPAAHSPNPMLDISTTAQLSPAPPATSLMKRPSPSATSDHQKPPAKRKRK